MNRFLEGKCKKKMVWSLNLEQNNVLNIVLKGLFMCTYRSVNLNIPIKNNPNNKDKEHGKFTNSNHCLSPILKSFIWYSVSHHYKVTCISVQHITAWRLNLCKNMHYYFRENRVKDSEYRN